MSAMQARGGIDRQLCVVVGCHIIPCQGKIIILVDKPDINPCRTRLTMVAVHAGACDRVRRKRADDGVILFLVGGGEE